MDSLPASGVGAATDVDIVHDIPGVLRFGVWNNVMLARWECSANAQGVACLQDMVRRFQAAHPGGRQSGIHVIREGVGLPTSEARAGLMEMIKGQADQFAAIGIVICGSGFVTSAVRSFLTGLRFAAPRSFDFRLHGKIYEVLKWFPAAHLERTGESLDVRQLVRVLHTFAGDLESKG